MSESRVIKECKLIMCECVKSIGKKCDIARSLINIQ